MFIGGATKKTSQWKKTVGNSLLGKKPQQSALKICMGGGHFMGGKEEGQGGGKKRKKVSFGFSA